MSNAQVNTQAAAATPKADKVKLVLAAIPATAGKTFAAGIVGAVVKREKADVDLLNTVSTLCASIGVAISAAQYDKQIKPDLAKAFAKKVALGQIVETTAASYQSRVKTATLAILAKMAEPLAGESFQAFTARVSPMFGEATLPGSNAKVWDGKVGRAAGSGGKASSSTVTPLRAASNPETNEPAILAAALIVTGGNRARAEKLAQLFPAFGDDFDKWTATILTDTERAKRRQTGGSQA